MQLDVEESTPVSDLQLPIAIMILLETCSFACLKFGSVIFVQSEFISSYGQTDRQMHMTPPCICTGVLKNQLHKIYGSDLQGSLENHGLSVCDCL